jgi:hypothetical protein
MRPLPFSFPTALLGTPDWSDAAETGFRHKTSK